MSSPLGLEGRGGVSLVFWAVGGVGKFSGYRGGIENGGAQNNAGGGM